MSASDRVEMRCLPDNRIPAGRHLCDGAILQITQSPALFSLPGNCIASTWERPQTP